MKPINEIRIRLSGLFCLFFLSLFSEYYPPGSGWFGLLMFVLVCGLGAYAGCFITSILITLKKWWKE